MLEALSRDDDPGIAAMDAAPALDWQPVRGPRWYDLLADAAAGVLILAGLTYLALVLT